MSDKQLTVAEILARAAKDSRPPTSRPRRRRRSIEEGGISVAELTGSIPRVDKAPEQPRHTAQPLDLPTAHDDAFPASDAAPTAPAETHSEQKPNQPAPAASSHSAEDRSRAATDTAAVEAAEQADTADEPTAAEGSTTTPVGERSAGRKRQDDADTVVLNVVREGDPVRFTTDTFPAVAPEQAAAPGAAADPERIPAVDEPVSNAHAPYSTEAGEDSEHGHHAKPERSEASEPLAEAPPTVAPSHEEAALPAHAEIDDSDDTDLAQPEDEQETSRGISVAMVVGMTVIAVVIGAAIFKGFQMLWGNFNSAITAILAVAVTAAIVGVVHAMRTEKDKLSMCVAGVVGLVLTFGPYLIAGI